MITYIYTLSDGKSIRYIGKSDNPQDRLKEHIKKSKNCKTRKDKWILSLLEKNEKPTIEILEEIESENWESSEIYWISQFKTWGFDIVNGTEGGEGSNGFKNKKHTKETIEKCRIAARSNEKVCISLGSKNGKSKLTEKSVIEIKELLKNGKSRLFISRMYRVSKTNITKIANKQIWGWL
jgi:predicted GIY-YIG superfamily endonuclease